MISSPLKVRGAGGVMAHLYNSKNLKQQRRSLRRSQTDAEKKLWQVLRDKQVQGLKFFRQYSVGKYVLDFYCSTVRLAIELDGGQHMDSGHDVERTSHLARQGIFVLRFWNNDVLSNLEGVCERIVLVIKDLKR